MKTLQVQNGDLQLDSGGRLQFVKGTSKLLQDLALWLREDYGTGYTTPSFGSFLPSKIGQAITASSVASIQVEIRRVLELYKATQILQLQLAQTTQQLSLWNKSEILQSIDNIQIQQGMGFVAATVSITTLNGTATDLNLVVTPNGIQVQNG